MASNEELRRAKEIGSTGGSVNTNGRTWQDRNQLDKAVNDGKRGK